MITAGVDVGAETIKVVLLSNHRILGSSTIQAGLDRRSSSKEALKLATDRAGIVEGEIERVTATGIGRKEVPYAGETVFETVADARGIVDLFPTVRTVIDIGAEKALCVQMDARGKMTDFATNDRCAAGVGAFVESMSRALEMTVEEMGSISLRSTRDILLNLTCVVFAESEVVSLIHSKTPREDIAAAVHQSIAARTISMVKRMGVKEDVAFIGGVARNVGVAAKLRKGLGLDIFIPEKPEIVGALGAAILALEQGAR